MANLPSHPGDFATAGCGLALLQSGRTSDVGRQGQGQTEDGEGQDQGQTGIQTLQW